MGLIIQIALGILFGYILILLLPLILALGGVALVIGALLAISGLVVWFAFNNFTVALVVVVAALLIASVGKGLELLERRTSFPAFQSGQVFLLAIAILGVGFVAADAFWTKYSKWGEIDPTAFAVAAVLVALFVALGFLVRGVVLGKRSISGVDET